MRINIEQIMLLNSLPKLKLLYLYETIPEEDKNEKDYVKELLPNPRLTSFALDYQSQTAFKEDCGFP